MPSEAAPEIAREGNYLLCEDPDGPLIDGRVYAVLIDGQMIVRRVQIRPDGVHLKAGANDSDPIVIRPDETRRLLPVARVLAAISLQAL